MISSMASNKSFASIVRKDIIVDKDTVIDKHSRLMTYDEMTTIVKSVVKSDDFQSPNMEDPIEETAWNEFLDAHGEHLLDVFNLLKEQLSPLGIIDKNSATSSEFIKTVFSSVYPSPDAWFTTEAVNNIPTDECAQDV
jgi:hypothetical protein